MSPIVSSYMLSEANKTLAGIIDEAEQIKQAALDLDLVKVLEGGGEGNFAAFSQALATARLNLTSVTLALVVASAVMQGETPGGEE